MKTFDTYAEAKRYARIHNQTVVSMCDPLVTVYGPEDNEGTVMKLSEAISEDFDYEWEA
jgi:hypothetical protein